MQEQKLPRHIAIIMDGNGRWARQQGQGRTFGHAKGGERAKEITRACSDLGIEALTLYTFSTENWQRPAGEVGFLMTLLLNYLVNEARELLKNGIRFRAIGFVDMLPEKIQREIRLLEEESAKNKGMYLNLALSYGSRQEILRAARNLAQQVADGSLKASDIDETRFSGELFTAGQPDPDLLIRTGGDHRISNYLLWQSAYTEFYFTELCWPDFGKEQLREALNAFGARERRFGALSTDASDEAAHG